MVSSEEASVIPVITIVGWSGSGKTTLIEKLIPELRSRGYRVATVKHQGGTFEMDREGKDTWRHRRAGAVCTVISSPSGLALLRDMDHDASLDEIRGRFIHDADIILGEGFKKEGWPKIEVFRDGPNPEPIFARSGDLVAMVSDRPRETEAPCLGLDDVEGLADLIEERFLSGSKRP